MNGKYIKCPNCGAHLDFGEMCDCKGQKENDVEEPKADKQESEVKGNDGN